MIYRLEDLDDLLEMLRPQLRMAVIYGGDSREEGTVLYRTHQTRFWKSYKEVAGDIEASLQRLGFRHIFLMREGPGLAAQIASEGIHLAWLNSGGIQGYDPLCHAPALLEGLGVPYIGHSPAQAALLDNKYLFKLLLQGLGLPTPPFLAWHPAQGSPPAPGDAHFQRVFGDSPAPLVVKPSNGRASRQIHYVERPAELSEAMAEVYHQTHNQVLVERYLPGREFAVGGGPSVLRRGGAWVRSEPPWCFAHLERRLDPEEKIFQSKDKRPITGGRIWLLKRKGDAKLIDRMTKLCCGVYRALHLGALVRVDMREDSDGRMQILEVNPKPDLQPAASDGSQSLLAQGLASSAMSYDELILSQIAARLDHAFSHCLPTVSPILELIEGQPPECA